MSRFLGWILETILNFCEDVPEWLELQWLRLRVWESHHWLGLGYFTIGLLGGELFVSLTPNAAGIPIPVFIAWIIATGGYCVSWTYRKETGRFDLPVRLEHSPFSHLPDLVRAKGRDENGKPFWDKPPQEETP